MKRWLIAGSLGLVMFGCGHKESASSPSPSPSGVITVAPTATATVTETVTTTPDASASAEATPDRAYNKLKDDAKDLALGKGYKEAIPVLNKALEIRKDDPEVYFYLMMCEGNLEDAPSPKSEAYANAKKVLELAPSSDFATRARDYIIAAESEPKKAKDFDDETAIEGSGEYNLVKNGLYKTQAPAFLIESPGDGLTADMQKQLWWVQVHPDAVTEKVALPKGTQLSIRATKNYYISKNSWRGVIRREGQAVDFDTNDFVISALCVEVEDGPLKGKQGWIANQMDRFRGQDDKGHNVWAVKNLPVVALPHKGDAT